MTQTKNNRKGFIDRINIKNFSIPITLFSISIVINNAFDINNSKNNNVTIGETGGSSNLSIVQNNGDENNLSLAGVFFYISLILGCVTLLITLYNKLIGKK